MKQQISIIIPILNEVSNIRKLLEHLLASSSSENIAEIIVVDGGSTDGSQSIVNVFSDFNTAKNTKVFHDINHGVSKTNIKLINSEKGRAKQMNLGSKTASGDILYFLHADSFPPNNFDAFIIKEVNNGNKAGCFRMQFDSKHWWLRLASWLTKFNWRACRGGDQSQFITKTLFNAIGGFDENYIIYEDNVLINALYSKNQFVVINKKLISSARMYRKHGIWNLQYHYWSIYIKKWLGADAKTLYEYYKKKVY